MENTMQVKGAALIFMPKCIGKLFGKDGLELWLSKLSPQAKRVFTSSIDASAWYPLKEVLTEPMAVICQLFYNWDPMGAWEFGRHSADYGLRGIYRLFVKFGSPEFLVNKASTILPGYYDPCTMEVLENGHGLAIVRITKFPEIDKMIEYRIGGWMEAALEICGCQAVRVEITKAMTRLSAYTEYRVRWEGK